MRVRGGTGCFHGKKGHQHITATICTRSSHVSAAMQDTTAAVNTCSMEGGSYRMTNTCPCSDSAGSYWQ
jgi:hypothetical protein